MAEAPALEAEPDQPRRRALAALEVPGYRYLWFNAFSFFIGRGMQLVAVSWLVLDMTDSPTLVGAVLFTQGAPLAIFSLPAGVWADRVDRRLLLITSQAVSTLTTAALAALIVADVVTTPAVFALSFVMGTAMALGQPSRQALVPALVGPERLMNAIVLNNLVQNLSFVIGPAIAGGLLAGVGFGGTFIVQVGILAAGLPWLFFIRPPRIERRPQRESIVTEVREGMTYIAESSFIRSLFAVTAFTGIFFVGTYQAVLPVFARDILDVGSAGLGILSAAFGVGMFAGSVFIASRSNFERKGEVLLRSLLVGSGVFFIFAVSGWFPLSLVTMIAWGFGAAFFMNLTITLIQANTPDRLMGRVMSVQALAFYGVSPLGNLEAGALAELFNAQTAAVVGSVAVALMAVWFLLRQPQLREAT